MGFLDTISQRDESRLRGSQPAAVHDPKWVHSTGTRQTGPAPELWRSNRMHPAVIWIAGLVVVAAVGVGAWLGIRKTAAVAPTALTSADAASAEQTHVDKPDPKRQSTRRREIVHSAINHGSVIDAKAPETATEIQERTSASNEEVAPVVTVAETGASRSQLFSDATAEALVAALHEDDFVYSSEQTGVIAPRLESLGFVHPLVKGFQTRTSTIELLVSKSGAVERAKISSTPRNWEDAMLISRAKMLRFVPAQRNGYPVRYRLLMRVDTTP